MSESNDETEGNHTYQTAYPPQLLKNEEALLKQRPKWKGGGVERAGLVGFGLSGGGIRSATFCLGVFQELAKLGLLGDIDYISSVSGGSYFASFFGRLFTRPDLTGGGAEVQKILSPNQQDRSGADLQPSWKSGIFDWLRNNGRYLAPKGGGDVLIGLATALRNWLTVQFIMALSVMAVLLAAQVLRLALKPQGDVPAPGFWWWSPFFILVWAGALLWVIPSGAAYWIFHLPEPGSEGGAAAKPLRAHAHLASGWAVMAMLLLFAAAGGLAGAASGRMVEALALALGSFVCMAGFAWWAARRARTKFPPPADAQDPFARMMSYENKMVRCDDARNRLSAALRAGLAATLATLAFALVDTAGQMLYARQFCSTCNPAQWIAGLYAALAAFAPFAHWIAGALRPRKKSAHPAPSLSLVAGIGAAAVILPALLGLDMFSHAIAYGFLRPADAPAALMAAASPVRVQISLKVGGERESEPRQAVESKTAPPAVTMEFEHRGKEAAGATPAPGALRQGGLLLFALAAAIFFSYLVGADSSGRKSPAMVFLNRTSLHPIYTARLIRAYLGASNKARHGDGKPVTEVLGGDDLSHERYWYAPERFFYERGAPLHLLNMTLNETIEGESQIEQRDRKGLGMAVGPAGLSVGVRHHAIYHEPRDPEKIMIETVPDLAEPGFRVFAYKEGYRDQKTGAWIGEFKGEKLSLGNWTGISGAAVATGMGFRGSLGLSLLTGFFNIRLGYWWDSGIENRTPSTRISRNTGSRLSSWFPVQSYLIDEFLGRFHSTSRQRWYLSDGGNFENLGGYELIRRRLPLMVIIDAGCDPDFDFDDLAGLVRKARLDFNAEIEFLEPGQIKEQLGLDLKPEVLRWYGPIEQLRRGKRADEPAAPPSTGRHVFFKSSDTARYSLRHAAFARVRYLDDQSVSFLILIKPTMVGDEPADVIQYHSSHPAFPHEGTSDQFFDEAQWESYRRLGQHIAEKIFSKPERGDRFAGFLPANKA